MEAKNLDDIKLLLHDMKNEAYRGEGSEVANGFLYYLFDPLNTESRLLRNSFYKNNQNSQQKIESLKDSFDFLENSGVGLTQEQKEKAYEEVRNNYGLNEDLFNELLNDRDWINLWSETHGIGSFQVKDHGISETGDIHMIVYFEKVDAYLKFKGFYSSYSGYFMDINNSVEVKPHEVIHIEYKEV